MCWTDVSFGMYVLELFSNRDLFSPDAKDVELLSFDVICVIK